MIRHVLIIILLTGYAYVSAQQKSSADYYTRLTVHNFRKDNSLNQIIDFEHPDYQKLNAAIFFATNEQRRLNKLRLLTYSALLEESATMHSTDMCDKNFFSHTNPRDRKKREPNDRAKIVGILNPHLAENIAKEFGLQYESNRNVRAPEPGKFIYPGETDSIPPHTYLSLADALLKSWMNSKGHRRNVLSDNALQLGCGTYMYHDKGFNLMPTFMATQNFQEYEAIDDSR